MGVVDVGRDGGGSFAIRRYAWRRGRYADAVRENNLYRDVTVPANHSVDAEFTVSIPSPVPQRTDAASW